MRIPLANTTTDLVVTNPPRLENLTAGKTVEMTVKAVNSNGHTQLQLGNTTIEAHTDLPLKPGQKLHLQVSNADQKIILKLLQPNLQQTNQITNALKKLLPQQAPLTTLLNTLQLTTPSSEHGTAIIKHITSLLAQFSTQKQVETPSGLKQAIDNSGLFLEKKLGLENTSSLSQDFKANLLLLKSFISIKKETLPTQNKSKKTPQTLPQKNTFLAPTTNKTTQTTTHPSTISLTQEAPSQAIPQQLLSLLKNTPNTQTEQKDQIKQITYLLQKNNYTQRAEINHWISKNTASQNISHQETIKLQELLSITASTKHSPDNAKNHAKALIQNLLPSLKSSSRQQIQNSLLVLKSLLAQSRIFSGRETAGINQQLEQKQTDTLHPYLQRLFNQLSKKTLAIPPNQPLTTPSQRLTTTPKTTDTATEDLSLDDFKLELTKQADSAIARITTMQLNQLIKSDDETHWQLELPIRNEQDIDVLTLTIDKEKSSTQDEANFLWKMGLTFNFKKMGNTHARIMLSGEKASVTFWAEKQPTAELIQNNLDLLEAGLKLTGLAVGTLSCQVGTAPPTNTNDISQGTLLNEKA